MALWAYFPRLIKPYQTFYLLTNIGLRQKRFSENEKANKKKARNEALICDKKVWCPQAKWYQAFYRLVYVREAFLE